MGSIANNYLGIRILVLDYIDRSPQTNLTSAFNGIYIYIHVYNVCLNEIMLYEEYIMYFTNE